MRLAAHPHPGRIGVRHLFGTVVADVFPAIARGVTAGGVAWRAFRPGGAAVVLLRLLVECFLGYSERVDRCGHTAVEHHLRDYLGDLFLGNADMQRAGDVALDHLRAVAEHHQRGDGAEAAGLQVDGRAVVDFAVDDGVHEAHYIGRQLGHRRRGLRIVLRPVVAHTEIGCGLVKVCNQVFIVVFFFQAILFQVRLVGTQVRVVVVEVGGHGVHLCLGEITPTLTLPRGGEDFSAFRESASSGGLPS